MPGISRDNGDRLHGLDHLRALAIGFVFIYHYSTIFKSPHWLGPVASFGWSGVDLFFVLSGYLIGGGLLDRVRHGQGISYSNFYLRRLCRIMPAFWVTVAIYFLVPGVIERSALAPWWRFLTFTQNFGLDNRVHGAFSHAWSLCVEEHFYLIVPGAIALFAGRRWSKYAWFVGGLLVLFGAVARWWRWESYVSSGDLGFRPWLTWLYYPTYCRLDGLLAGIGVAALLRFYPVQRDWLTKRPWPLLFLGIVLLYFASAISKNDLELSSSVIRFPLVSLGYGLVLLAALSPMGFLARFQSKLTRTVAVLSYALYLTHKMVIHVLQEVGTRELHLQADSTLMLAICIAGCLAVAWLVHVIVERPFMRFGVRMTHGGEVALRPA